MKKYFVLLLVLILALTAAVQADDLSDVVKNGVLRMGSAPEYVPFVFYDKDGNMDGLDVALIKEIGRRMGVEVRTVDIAFDGLIDSLKIGQVDIIGRGMSRTKSRMEEIDFSRIYYKGQAQFIGLASLNKPAQVDHSSFKGLKIGVEKATSFEQWIRENLVAEGNTEAKDVFLYSNAGDLVKALNRKDVDLIVLDQDIYDQMYKKTGEYQVFYDGFLEESYAFGLAKGSTLTAVIDRHLTDMLKDGTAQKIANDYFTRDYTKKGSSEPAPAPTPVPVMPVVIPTKAPAACVNSMTFGGDVTIKDGHQVAPGERFRKTWRVINNGTCTWNYDYSFVYVSGDQMGGSNVSVPGIVGPGQYIDIAVDLIAPQNPGTYKGYWQMRSPQGVNFGETIWVKVRVAGSAPQPVYPTPTPEDGQHFIPININSFYPDAYEGYGGECINVYWSTTGAAAVRISVDGIQVYQGNVPNGYSEICSPLTNIGAHEIELEALNVVTSSYSSFWYTTYEHETGLNPPDDFDGGWAGMNYYENEEDQGGWAGSQYDENENDQGGWAGMNYYENEEDQDSWDPTEEPEE